MVTQTPDSTGQAVCPMCWEDKPLYRYVDSVTGEYMADLCSRCRKTARIVSNFLDWCRNNNANIKPDESPGLTGYSESESKAPSKAKEKTT